LQTREAGRAAASIHRPTRSISSIPDVTRSFSRPVICRGTRAAPPDPVPGSAADRRIRPIPSPPEARVELILLTGALQPTTEVLPALGLLSHQVTVLPQDAGALVDRSLGDAVLVDARRDLMGARAFLRLLTAMGTSVPVIAVLTEGGLIAMSGEWAVDDFVLDTAGPAELDARLRVAVERRAAESEDVTGRLEIGDLTIDESTYTARLSGTALDLTYKEFELLKFLALHPGRVFTRSHLVQEVWGYDYFGGTRTVDVHVRRLRAKLGAEHEAMIGTVRNVGYKFVRPAELGRREDADAAAEVASRLTSAPMDSAF
jgi:DNA-binding response OmpR family regulator